MREKNNNRTGKDETMTTKKTIGGELTKWVLVGGEVCLLLDAIEWVWDWIAKRFGR